MHLRLRGRTGSPSEGTSMCLSDSCRRAGSKKGYRTFMRNIDPNSILCRRLFSILRESNRKLMRLRRQPWLVSLNSSTCSRPTCSSFMKRCSWRSNSFGIAHFRKLALCNCYSCSNAQTCTATLWGRRSRIPDSIRASRPFCTSSVGESGNPYSQW